MEVIVYGVLAIIYGVCAVFCYRAGMRAGAAEKRPAEGLQQPKKRKPRPMTEGEKEYAELQRKIDEFRG